MSHNPILELNWVIFMKYTAAILIQDRPSTEAAFIGIPGAAAG